MTTGLLWFDASKGKPIEAKVSEAVSAYRAKPRFGDRAPDTCYVHPSTMSGAGAAQVDGVRLTAMRAVRPHYFYVVHAGGDGGGPARVGRGAAGTRARAQPRDEGRTPRKLD